VPGALGLLAFVAIGSVVVGAGSPPIVVPPQALTVAIGSPAPVATPAPPALVVIPGSRPVAQRPEDAPDAAAARLGLPAPVGTLSGYQWPLPRGRITLPFGPTHWGSRVVDGALFHDGVDMATFCGDRIVAAHDGVVLAASRRFDKQIGWVGDLTRYFHRLDQKHLWITLPIVVITDDGNGYRSIYAHFEKVVVKVGQTIHAGQLLGYEGATGRASGCHLHFGLFSPQAPGRFAIDPDVAKRMKLPGYQVARVDPLLVLPPRPVAKPKPVASPSPSPTP
jgi:murein DD-endopeptidase MepM/ murein hydrolase activator NlpD